MSEVRVSCPNCGTGYRVAEDLLGRQVACRRCSKRFILAHHEEKPETSDDADVALSADDSAFLLGRLAVRFRMLTAEQLEQIIADQRAVPATERKLIGELLLESGLLERSQIEFLVSVQQMKAERAADRRFGELAVQNDMASREQVEQAMREQKSLFVTQKKEVLIGDLLVEQGLITEEQRDALLAAQKRLHAESPPLEIKVTISEDSLNAFVALVGEGDHLPERAAVEQALTQIGITFGIVKSAIDEVSEGERPDGPVLVAAGVAPQPGQDAELEYFFDAHPLKASHETEDGLIDFKDRGEIPQVEPGTELARKSPARPGVPGTDVFGHPLEPMPPADPQLNAGSGTELSEDGLLLCATASGRPSMSASGVISVYPEFQVDGDVGLATGHINFAGRVLVAGAIQEGFKVKCGELIAREVQEAEVETEGDCVVSGGVIGARIKSGGSLKAHYLQRANLDVMGDVLIEKEAIESEVECSGAFIGERCKVIDTTIASHKGVFAGEIGSEVSRPCRLTVGDDDRVAHEITVLEEDITRLEEALPLYTQRLEAAKKRLGKLDTLIIEQAQVQDIGISRKRELEGALAAAEKAGIAAAGEKYRQELAQLEPHIAEAEAGLEALFTEQDSLNGDMNELPEQEAADRAAIVTQRAEVARLQEWAKQDAGVPVVEASGVIRDGTVIKTPHTEGRLKGDKKRARLEEREEQNERGERVWRLTLTALSTKKR